MASIQDIVIHKLQIQDTNITNTIAEDLKDLTKEQTLEYVRNLIADLEEVEDAILEE